MNIQNAVNKAITDLVEGRITEEELEARLISILHDTKYPLAERLFSVFGVDEVVERVFRANGMNASSKRNLPSIEYVDNDKFDEMLRTGEIELIDTGRPDED